MCPQCTALLVNNDNGDEPLQIQLDEDQEHASLSDAVPVASRQFAEMMVNRGKLTKPSDFSLNVVREICFMWRALTCTQETRLLLLQANSSCEVFVRVVTQVFVDGVQTFSAQLAEEEKQGRRGEKTDDYRMKNTRSI
ncbi:hypothetical protein GWK47_008723 [Chionoecetes opilio]|uniref:Uncharacterized protein n=1 Tax=Chionoecetes opilio TaxID=41210 RepID=A0A8J4Y5W0_CHIOP|nr:hypothetical protein GWK47_008723 [Chionoecetes opilio]